MLENLNFMPDEHSYVSPWIEPEEDTRNTTEEEKKDDLDGDSKGLPNKGVPPPKDLKKMSAAEKKKADEEAKKKAEEDSKAAAAMADSAESRVERERAEE